ncbi:MAG: hypothetical protein PF689_05335 [Deltaproteobacteria bacterium]|jgi:cytoskeletal protein RodZ|nr:hypothetical protein [Deltaproteobacteria bacterium]
MNFFIIFLLLVVAFFLGFLIAIQFVNNNQENYPEKDPSETDQLGKKSFSENPSEIKDEVVHEEQTRKVNKIEIEDLLHLDGDVIEAEPAPTVPLVHYERVSKELKILKQEIQAFKEKENNKDSGHYPVACDKDISK